MKPWLPALLVGSLLVPGPVLEGEALGAAGGQGRPAAKFSLPPWSPPPVSLPARPGDRLSGFPVDKPLAILVWAAWSRPSVLEKRLLEEITATGSALASRVRVVALDVDDPASARSIEKLGGAPSVPALYLVRPGGTVWRRYLGWPARNPGAVRSVLIRDLTALAAHQDKRDKLKTFTKENRRE